MYYSTTKYPLTYDMGNVCQSHTLNHFTSAS